MAYYEKCLQQDTNNIKNECNVQENVIENKTKIEFPEPPGSPPLNNTKRVKKEYKSKRKTGTEGCPEFHSFISQNAKP